MNAKETFLKSSHASLWGNMVETETFRVAVEYSLLHMVETRRNPSLDESLMLEGARLFIKHLETIHLPPTSSKDKPKTHNLDHTV